MMMWLTSALILALPTCQHPATTHLHTVESFVIVYGSRSTPEGCRGAIYARIDHRDSTVPLAERIEIVVANDPEASAPAWAESAEVALRNRLPFGPGGEPSREQSGRSSHHGANGLRTVHTALRRVAGEYHGGLFMPHPDAPDDFQGVLYRTEQGRVIRHWIESTQRLRNPPEWVGPVLLLAGV